MTKSPTQFAILLLTATAIAISGCAPDANTAANPGQAPGARKPDSQVVTPVPIPSPRQEIELPQADGTTTQARIWDVNPVVDHAGVIFVGGIDGEYIQPADNIYDRLAPELQKHGIPCVFVRYRSPDNTPYNLDLSVADAKAGVAWLKSRGVTRIAMVAWSFGGAVMSHTTAETPEIQTVIAFAPQSLYTEPVEKWRPDQSLLLIHSKDDTNVPYYASEDIFERTASTRKQLLTLHDVDHELVGRGEELAPVALEWLNGNFFKLLP